MRCVLIAMGHHCGPADGVHFNGSDFAVSYGGPYCHVDLEIPAILKFLLEDGHSFVQQPPDT